MESWIASGRTMESPMNKLIRRTRLVREIVLLAIVLFKAIELALVIADKAVNYSNAHKLQVHLSA
jgi:hypothetical protein